MTRTDLQERLKHRAVVLLNEQDIRTLLNLPDDISVRAVIYDDWRMCFKLHLVSECFDEVPDMAESPIIDKRLDTQECKTHGYHVYIDFPDNKKDK